MNIYIVLSILLLSLSLIIGVFISKKGVKGKKLKKGKGKTKEEEKRIKEEEEERKRKEEEEKRIIEEERKRKEEEEKRKAEEKKRKEEEKRKAEEERIYKESIRGRLFAINKSRRLMYSDDLKGNKWKYNVKSPNYWKQINIDKDYACGINNSNRIYCKDISQNNWKQRNWIKRRGNNNRSFKRVSIDDNDIFALDVSGNLWRSYKNKNYWQKINTPRGSFKEFDISKGNICGVQNTSRIYCKDYKKNKPWQRIHGELDYISISDGRIVGFQNKNKKRLYYCPNLKGSPWSVMKTPNKNYDLNHVDFDKNKVCVINKYKQTHCKTGVKSNDWRKVDVVNKFKTISVSGK